MNFAFLCGTELRNKSRGAAAAAVGRAIRRAAPWLMKGLSVAGTAAMFLVGGGILVHGVPWLHHALEGALRSVGPALQPLAEMLGNALAGVLAGIVVLAGVTLAQRLWRRMRPAGAA